MNEMAGLTCRPPMGIPVAPKTSISTVVEAVVAVGKRSGLMVWNVTVIGTLLKTFVVEIPLVL